MKDSITPKDKELLEYLYNKACDIADFCHRNNMIVPVSIQVHPDFSHLDVTYDYRDVSFSERYESGNTKRIVSLGFNNYSGRSEFHESLYEDKEDE